MRFFIPEREGKDARISGKEASKLNKARKRGYISTGEVKRLTPYLSVPKRGDIRMVYNGTSSGLNDSLWGPHFALLTV